MPREKESYRDNLESILNFTEGTHLLDKTQVAKYVGRDVRTVIKRYEFTKGYISAEKLARALS